jgi:hypothetical protein
MALAIEIVSPGHDGPVGFQAQAVIFSPSDCDEVSVGRRDMALAIAVSSPTHD